MPALTRFVDKMLKDGEAVLQVSKASRFVKGLLEYDDKAQLLQRLVLSKEHGFMRVREALSSGAGEAHFSAVTGPLFEMLSAAEWQRPLLRQPMMHLLLHIWTTPFLLEELASLSSSCSPATCTTICSFMCLVTSCITSARREPMTLQNLEQLMLRSTSGTERLSILCLRDGIPAAPAHCALVAGPKSMAPAWEPHAAQHAGGRHDNDHVNFRDIELLPTPAELLCQEPFLPHLMDTMDAAADIHQKVRSVLGAQFRLLREDVVAPMREQASTAAATNRYSGARTKCLEGARIVGVEFEPFPCGAACVAVAFTKKAGWDKSLWKESTGQYFSKGSMVCLRPQQQTEVNTEEGAAPPQSTTLFGLVLVKDVDKLCPAKPNQDPTIGIAFGRDTGAALRLVGVQHTSLELVMVSASYFAYRPVLEALQSMHAVPFPAELLDGQSVALGLHDSYLPAALDLPAEICTGDVVTIQRGEAFDAQALMERTSLDMSQGPPGTGKTFIGGTVARTILANTTCKVLCLCFTNHALDQFLEHLLDGGVKRIVRVGGRCTNPRLEPFKLQALTRGKRFSGGEASYHFDLKNRHTEVKERIESLSTLLTSPLTWEELLAGAAEPLSPDILASIVSASEAFGIPEEDVEGFIRAGGRKGRALKQDALFNQWARGHPPLRGMGCDHALWRLDRAARQQQLAVWRDALRAAVRDDLTTAINDAQKIAVAREEQRQREHVAVLKQARGFGITTTRAADSRALLEELAAEVVIVEEAGEVLEAHILTSVSETAKHMVLIGDHKQLRPKVESFRLTVEANRGYALNRSLFERLVTATTPLPHVLLKVQHRMRPEISSLVRACTYPELQDHPSVLNRPLVTGLGNRSIVFISHRQLEQGLVVPSGTGRKRRHSGWGERGGAESVGAPQSKLNHYEVEMAVAVVRFLLLQGYTPSQVVVLTPYLGQMREIRRALSKGEIATLISDMDLEELQRLQEDIGDDSDATAAAAGPAVKGGVRVATEQDLVVASLVRSNAQGKIGFLREPERANVLLSRARLGLIMIGNDATLRECDRTSLRLLLMVGAAACAASVCRVATPADCLPPKTMRRGEDQPYTPCGKCLKTVDSVDLPGGYTAGQVYCWQADAPDTIKCNTIVPHTFPDCGHEGNVECVQVTNNTAKCQHPCETTLECGHICTGTCSGCAALDPAHAPCAKICKRVLTCGHECSAGCHDPRPCPPCDKPCTMQCLHSKCGSKCAEVCAACVEPCSWICPHQGACPMPCGAPCTCLPCDKRCGAVMACGHQCPALCSEPCPAPELWCPQCGCHGDAVVDLIMQAPLSDINLDEPLQALVPLPCGHAYTAESLDGWIELARGYTSSVDSSGHTHWTGLSCMDGACSIKTCPACKCPISSVMRYGRVQRAAELKALDIKFLLHCQAQLRQLLQQETELQALLDSGGDAATRAMTAATTAGGLLSMHRCHLRMVRTQSPTRRVCEACCHIVAGCTAVDVMRVSAPATAPLLEALVAHGQLCCRLAEVQPAADVHAQAGTTYTAGITSLTEAIAKADKDNHLRLGGLARLTLARLHVTRAHSVGGGEADELVSQARTQLRWILYHNAAPVVKLHQEAQQLQQLALRAKQLTAAELQAIVAEVDRVEGGNNAGWTGAGHWFTCPGGHPYFIGECGGAMEQSACPDCGAAVGGHNHAVVQGNAQWQPGDLLHAERRDALERQL
ncbi:hypothetical protein JKP88DRAFT_249852 [Tribonema minus]|uniref:RZ-type domain-containing protein n=1 Tax=Tribonema minus TaxID=303371 RepID=A0A836C7W3_9STRA|nr:hypothetical protein JKP88DRAFT_249852 [Tribonema minus]